MLWKIRHDHLSGLNTPGLHNEPIAYTLLIKNNFVFLCFAMYVYATVTSETGPCGLVYEHIQNMWLDLTNPGFHAQLEIMIVIIWLIKSLGKAWSYPPQICSYRKTRNFGVVKLLANPNSMNFDEINIGIEKHLK